MSCQPMAGNLDLLQREEAMSNPAGNMVNEQVQRRHQKGPLPLLGGLHLQGLKQLARSASLWPIYLFGVGGVPASLRQTARETLDTLYRRRFQFQTDIPSHLACYSRSIAWEADKSNAFRESLFWGRFAFNNADIPCPPFSWSRLWCAPRI